MPIVIPALLQNMPVPMARLDPASGSSGQTNAIIQKRLDCFLWYDAGDANCGINLGNGNQGSWSINEIDECSKRPRLSFATKYLVGSETATVQPSPTAADRAAFLAEWNDVTAAMGPGIDTFVASSVPPAIPAGYTFDGRTATKVAGNVTYRLSPSTSRKDICVTENPANPTCTLDGLVKVGISLTASIKIGAPHCVSLVLGIASAKFSIYRLAYEAGDALLTMTNTTQNVWVNP